jgi:hypothetical protein
LLLVLVLVLLFGPDDDDDGLGNLNSTFFPGGSFRELPQLFLLLLVAFFFFFLASIRSGLYQERLRC